MHSHHHHGSHSGSSSSSSSQSSFPSYPVTHHHHQPQIFNHHPHHHHGQQTNLINELVFSSMLASAYTPAPRPVYYPQPTYVVQQETPAQRQARLAAQEAQRIQREQERAERARLLQEQKDREEQERLEYQIRLAAIAAAHRQLISQVPAMDFASLQAKINELQDWSLEDHFKSGEATLFNAIFCHEQLAPVDKHTLLQQLLLKGDYSRHYVRLLQVMVNNLNYLCDPELNKQFHSLYLRYIKDSQARLSTETEYNIWKFLIVSKSSESSTLSAALPMIARKHPTESVFQFIALLMNGCDFPEEVMLTHARIKVDTQRVSSLQGWDQYIKDIAKHRILFLELKAGPGRMLIEDQENKRKIFLNDGSVNQFISSIFSNHKKTPLILYNAIRQNAANPEGQEAVVSQCFMEQKTFEIKFNDELKRRLGIQSSTFHLEQSYVVQQYVPVPLLMQVGQAIPSQLPPPYSAATNKTSSIYDGSAMFPSVNKPKPQPSAPTAAIVPDGSEQEESSNKFSPR